MISALEVITQDQLTTSSLAGKVRVHYPRGAQTVLSVNFDAPGQPLITVDAPDTDGAYQQFAVLPNGNLLMLPDNPARTAYVVMGAGLVAV